MTFCKFFLKWGVYATNKQTKTGCRHSWSGYIYEENKQTNLISVFVLLSICFQPMTDCIQISFHCFRLTRFPFEIRALELSLKHWGDIKFLLLSHWAGARRRGASVSTGCQTAFWVLECWGYSCWVKKQLEALCHSFLYNQRRPTKGFLLSLDV